MSIAVDAGATLLIDRPQSYEEMRSRPRFNEVINQEEHKLLRVLTHYHFAKLCPCGLSDCRTAHHDGFLVETTDGLETNVGHICGRNTFGEDFDIAHEKYRRARERQELLQRAKEILASAPEIKRRIADLNGSQYGIRWVGRVGGALHGLLGQGLYSSLATTQRRGDLAVKESRERTEEEIERFVLGGGRRDQARYETVVHGTLHPMPWIDFDFTGRLRGGLLVPLDQLERLALLGLEATPTPNLKSELKRFAGWEEVLRDAEEAASSAVRMLGRENLALLVKWIPEHMVGKRRALAEWIDSKPHQALLHGLS